LKLQTRVNFGHHIVSIFSKSGGGGTFD